MQVAYSGTKLDKEGYALPIPSRCGSRYDLPAAVYTDGNTASDPVVKEWSPIEHKRKSLTFVVVRCSSYGSMYACSIYFGLKYLNREFEPKYRLYEHIDPCTLHLNPYGILKGSL